ncbi:MAG TPA: RnfH family protein [Solimonas sp.]|nr:RnfH family protein [Solimonas sp.]
MAKPETLEIEVVYALPDRQILIALRVPAGTRVSAVLAQTDLPRRFPEIDPATATLGIFGQRVPADHELRAGDRVEIYRPLRADPKQARRARVARERGSRP